MSSTLTEMLIRKKYQRPIYFFGNLGPIMDYLCMNFSFSKHSSTCKTSEWLGHKKL